MYIVFRTSSLDDGTIRGGREYYVYDSKDNSIEKLDGIQLKDYIEIVGVEDFFNVQDDMKIVLGINFSHRDICACLDNELLIMHKGTNCALWYSNKYILSKSSRIFIIESLNKVIMDGKTVGKSSYVDFIRMLALGGI